MISWKKIHKLWIPQWFHFRSPDRPSDWRSFLEIEGKLEAWKISRFLHENGLEMAFGKKPIWEKIANLSIYSLKSTMKTTGTASWLTTTTSLWCIFRASRQCFKSKRRTKIWHTDWCWLASWNSSRTRWRSTSSSRSRKTRRLPSQCAILLTVTLFKSSSFQGMVLADKILFQAKTKLELGQKRDSYLGCYVAVPSEPYVGFESGTCVKTWVRVLKESCLTVLGGCHSSYPG